MSTQTKLDRLLVLAPDIAALVTAGILSRSEAQTILEWRDWSMTPVQKAADACRQMRALAQAIFQQEMPEAATEPSHPLELAPRSPVVRRGDTVDATAYPGAPSDPPTALPSPPGAES